jgi:hypothetical protein
MCSSLPIDLFQRLLGKRNASLTSERCAGIELPQTAAGCRCEVSVMAMRWLGGPNEKWATKGKARHHRSLHARCSMVTARQQP